MKKVQDKFKKGLKVTLGLSITLHLGFILSKFETPLWMKASPPPQKVKIVLVDKSVKKQVVNNELTGREEQPLDSKYLGEKNQTYDRQTVAREVGSFKVAALGQRDGSDLAGANRAPNPAQKRNQKLKNNKDGKKISLADLSMNAPITPNSAASAPKGLKTGKAKEIGLARNNDYVEDLPLGDVTNINTNEFKYYGFYYRIRQKLEQYWGQSLREKAERLQQTGRRIASVDKITALVITLDNKGNILNINVKSTSGIRELDQAAIESFTNAGPFPNPPRGMLKNGIATLEWGFVVQG